MPRDLFRALIAERIAANQTTLRGQILTIPRSVIYGTVSQFLPVVDVLIAGGVIISSVPIAANNQVLLYATAGSPVRLLRSPSGRVEVVGLDKRGIGNTYAYSVNMTPFTSTSGSMDISITSGATIGFSTRILNYGELASATSGGYGTTPYGAWALVNASGAIVNILA